LVLALFANLHLVVYGPGRRIVLGTGAELFFRQVVTDDAGAQ
jgi:hypothetical protein